MPYIRSEDKTEWTEDLEDVRSRITAIRASLASGSPAINGIVEITFDSGTGRTAERFTPQALFNELKYLKSERELLKRKLRGTNIIRTQTRRDSGVI